MSQIIFLTPASGPGSGTVTSISAGTGITLTPNPITTNGSVALTVPVAIANGGTNATSMATSNGTVYYDGTRLVTTATGTAGFVLTSNGAAAPTYQAAGGGPGTNIFLAFMNADQTNVTGAGTQATIIFNDITSNPGSYYNTATGIFTAPTTGNYFFTSNVQIGGTSAGANRVILLGTTTSIEYKILDENFVPSVAAGVVYVAANFMARLTVGQTCQLQLRVFGGAGDTLSVSGSAGGTQYSSVFSGYYVSA